MENISGRGAGSKHLRGNYMQKLDLAFTEKQKNVVELSKAELPFKKILNEIPR